MAQAPGKRAAATQAAPTLNLARMWQGDLAEPLAAFLPLNSIGVVGKLSRRCRDRLPAVFFNLARKHGALRASMAGFVEAIRGTGRDDSRFSGETLDSWVRREPGPSEGPFTAGEVTIDGSRCIKISTSAPADRMGYNFRGGLIKNFAAAERLCARQVKYRFCFTDSDPSQSQVHASSETGFAFLGFTRRGEGGLQKGLLVEPKSTALDPTGYRLVWWDDTHATPDKLVMDVKQGIWYDVTMTFDWRTTDPGWAGGTDLPLYVSVTGEDGSSRERVRFNTSRESLTCCWIYNYSASVSHYSSISVRYSKHKSRDGALDDWT